MVNDAVDIRYYKKSCHYFHKGYLHIIKPDGFFLYIS